VVSGVSGVSGVSDVNFLAKQNRLDPAGVYRPSELCNAGYLKTQASTANAEKNPQGAYSRPCFCYRVRLGW